MPRAEDADAAGTASEPDRAPGGRHIDHWRGKLDPGMTPPRGYSAARSRIMYIESKADGLEGPARIGRVYFSRTGKTLYYRGMRFQSLKGAGFKANCFELTTGDHYWISGPRKDRNDRLYGGQRGVEIDEEIRAEYLAGVD